MPLSFPVFVSEEAKARNGNGITTILVKGNPKTATALIPFRLKREPERKVGENYWR